MLAIILVKIIIYKQVDTNNTVFLMSFLCPSQYVSRLIEAQKEGPPTTPPETFIDICDPVDHITGGDAIFECFLTEMFLSFMFIAAVLHLKN